MHRASFFSNCSRTSGDHCTAACAGSRCGLPAGVRDGCGWALNSSLASSRFTARSWPHRAHRSRQFRTDSAPRLDRKYFRLLHPRHFSMAFSPALGISFCSTGTDIVRSRKRVPVNRAAARVAIQCPVLSLTSMPVVASRAMGFFAMDAASHFSSSSVRIASNWRRST